MVTPETSEAGEERFRALFETAKDAIVSADSCGNITAWNPAAEMIFGYTSSDVQGQPLTLIMPDRLRSAHSSGLARFLATRQPRVVGKTVELVGRRSNGTEFPLELSLSAWGEAAQPNFTGIIRDITPRKRAELLRAVQAGVTRVLADSGSLAEAIPKILQTTCELLSWDMGNLWLVDPASAKLRCTTSWCIEAMTAGHFINSTHAKPFDRGVGLPGRVWASGKSHAIADVASDPNFPRASAAREDGIRSCFGYPIVAAGEVIGVLEFLSRDLHPPDADLLDVMEALGSQLGQFVQRKQAEDALRISEAALRSSEAQLRQAQKMDAIGRLAGGVGHDFNNILSVVLSYTGFLLADLKPDEPMRADIQEIEAAGQRAAQLTRQLLAFSRQQVLQLTSVNLNDAIAGVETMLRRTIGDNVDLMTSLAERLWDVMADSGQIEQIIMNLVVNARDAMPRGGKLSVETRNVELSEAYAEAHLGVRPGPHVMLLVSDTGEGMDEATRARIFDPFFTTKEIGMGTGLGLSTVFGIVKQCGGSISVDSAPGKGTTFTITFPRAPETHTPLPTPVPSVPPRLASARGTETVLVVEDEDQVRIVARDILRRAGYEVLDARNAGEALLLCEQHPGPVHLMLTDVLMPHMTGPQLARRLAKIRPDMRVLCMSGYTGDESRGDWESEPKMAFIQKPITPSTLPRKVRDVLDEPTLPKSSFPIR